MKKIKFDIPVCNYKVKYKKNVSCLCPKKFELIKITLGSKVFTPNQKMVVTENTKIPIMDIYNKNLFTATEE